MIPAEVKQYIFFLNRSTSIAVELLKLGVIKLFIIYCVLNAGGIFSGLFSRLWGTKERRILILGLDGAGKTTILYRYVVVASLKAWCKLNVLLLDSMYVFVQVVPKYRLYL